jgi:hypothetical protein
MGLYYLDGGMSINRSFSEDYNTIYNDINDKYDLASKGIDVLRFHEMINANSSYYYDDKRENVDKEKMLMYYHNLIGYICSSISNFTFTINKCIKSESKLLAVAHKNRVSREINYLLTMRDLDDFKDWYNVHGNSTKSNRIKDSISTLADLF